MKIQAQAPGKLFLAGEYAITLAGQQSLVMAMNRYVTVELENQSMIDQAAKANVRIHSDQTGDWSFAWSDLESTPAPADFELVKQTLVLLKKWLATQKIEMVSLSIVIQSELVQNGKKLGLGSSAAVVCALIKAFNTYFQLALTAEQTYKLGVLATFSLDHFHAGSMGDLAAAAYGGLILYQRFDANWLALQLNEGRLLDLVSQSWPLLAINVIPFPSHWHLLVGWTGQPADTQEMLALNPKLTRLYQNQLAKKTGFLIRQLKQAIEEADFLRVITCLHLNQAALIQYAQAMHLPYLTVGLRRLLTIARQHGAAAKISGAGGGDNGIAITPDPKTASAIAIAWQKQGIIPLSLEIAPLQTKEASYDE